MRLLIELDEEVFNEIVSADDASHLSRAFLNGSYLYFKEALQNSTSIPDNATNGDVIKAMYPNIESRLDEKTGIMLVKWADGTMKTFKAIWWNTPYKAGKKPTCGDCKEWGTVNCPETYREPTKSDDICDSFKADKGDEE